MASPKMNLKLLVDRKGSRVLFAEVPKEFVDFLFHIFSLPLGTLIQFLGSNKMVGCLGKLKDSIQSFHGNYLQPGIKKEDIVNPKTAFNGDTFLLSNDASFEDQPGASIAVYRCANAVSGNTCTNYDSVSDSVSDSDSDSDYDEDMYETRPMRSNKESCLSNVTLNANSICPGCNCSMDVKMTVVQPKEVTETKEAGEKNKRGYVKEVVTYMVMDDLVVKPMSTISSIILINKFGVKDMSQLEEKTVSFGKEEGLELLIASLKTDKVLTTIFMH